MCQKSEKILEDLLHHGLEVWHWEVGGYLMNDLANDLDPKIKDLFKKKLKTHFKSELKVLLIVYTDFLFLANTGDTTW